MTCKHFGACASCKLYEMGYDEQLAAKSKQIAADFEPFFDGRIEVFGSASQGFRNRAEFGVYHHDDERFSFVMRCVDNGRVFIDSCAIVDEFISSSMQAVQAKITGNQTLKKKLFGIEFLSSGAGEVLATLIYHKKLDMQWADEVTKLSADTGIKIIGRSRGQRLVLDNDFVTARFDVGGKVYALRQVEGAFSQPNGGVNAKMLGWASSKLAGIGGDLIELYCGSGNFTVVSAGLFEKVFATEIASSLIELAKTNAANNGVENISYGRLSASETAEALNGVREFNRLRGVNLEEYNFSTIFVDPPRAGMDELSISLAQRFDNILYISCSPQSLARDLGVLTQTHCVESFALFDQFAYTHHIECGVFLRRK